MQRMVLWTAPAALLLPSPPRSPSVLLALLMLLPSCSYPPWPGGGLLLGMLRYAADEGRLAAIPSWLTSCCCCC